MVVGKSFSFYQLVLDLLRDLYGWLACRLTTWTPLRRLVLFFAIRGVAVLWFVLVVAGLLRARRRRRERPGHLFQQFVFQVNTHQTNQRFNGLSFRTIREFDTPATGQRGEYILDVIGRLYGPAIDFENFRPIPQTAAISVAGFKNVRYHGAPIRVS